MAVDLDQFPIYDDIVGNDNKKMSANWILSLSNFLQSLQGYLSQNGIFVPKLTTTQRDSIQNAQLGQLIYNTTTNKFQGYEGSPGAWVDLV